jgi:hypothetical protein
MPFFMCVPERKTAWANRSCKGTERLPCFVGRVVSATPFCSAAEARKQPGTLYTLVAMSLEVHLIFTDHKILFIFGFFQLLEKVVGKQRLGRKLFKGHLGKN